MAEKAVMISLRVTEKEAEMIRQVSTEAGMSVSQWIRHRIMGTR
jgi:hypothetical protein